MKDKMLRILEFAKCKGKERERDRLKKNRREGRKG
jgi:hypothetical protein